MNLFEDEPEAVVEKPMRWRVRTPQGVATGVEIEEIKPPSVQMGRWWKIIDPFGEFDVWPEGQIMVEKPEGRG